MNVISKRKTEEVPGVELMDLEKNEETPNFIKISKNEEIDTDSNESFEKIKKKIEKSEENSEKKLRELIITMKLKKYEHQITSTRTIKTKMSDELVKEIINYVGEYGELKFMTEDVAFFAKDVVSLQISTIKEIPDMIFEQTEKKKWWKLW